MESQKKQKRGGVFRKLICGASSIALAASLTPAAAFAAVDADGNVSYKMPTEPIGVQTTLTDANGNQYTQESLNVMLGTPPHANHVLSHVGHQQCGFG